MEATRIHNINNTSTPAPPPIIGEANGAPKRAPMSKRTKIIIVLCAIYLLSPIDLIPDPIPFFGQLDDLGAFFFAVKTALNAKES